MTLTEFLLVFFKEFFIKITFKYLKYFSQNKNKTKNAKNKKQKTPKIPS